MSWRDPQNVRHGTAYGYRGQGCRCEACRAAHALYQRRLLGRSPRKHGTYTGYSSYGCRCELCSEAKRIYQREYRRRVKS